MSEHEETFNQFSYLIDGDDITITQSCGIGDDDCVQLHRSQLAYVCERAGLIGGTEEQAARISQLEHRLVWMADQLETAAVVLPSERDLMAAHPGVEPFFLWHDLLLDSVSEMLGQLGIDWTPLEESEDDERPTYPPAPSPVRSPSLAAQAQAPEEEPSPQQSLFDAKEQAHEQQ